MLVADIDDVQVYVDVNLIFKPSTDEKITEARHKAQRKVDKAAIKVANSIREQVIAQLQE